MHSEGDNGASPGRIFAAKDISGAGRKPALKAERAGGSLVLLFPTRVAPRR